MGLRAVQFRRFITAIGGHIEVKIVPSAISTLVDNEVNVDVVLSNSYSHAANFTVFRVKTPTHIATEPKGPYEYSLRSGSDIHFRIPIKSSSPGQFNITKAIITLKEGSKLFIHDLRLNCNLNVEIAPLSRKLETNLQLGSIVNLSHHGPGSDLALIREATVLSDLHTIDWKSTARTGKFMIKEFYPETDPAVMLLVDKSILTHGREMETISLVQLGGLVLMFGSSTALGAIIYDGSAVIDYIPPASGVQSRQQILRSLLAATITAGVPPPSQGLTTLYAELVKTTRFMNWISNNEPPGRLDVYARSILPYYQSAATLHAAKLQRYGVFRAFERITPLSPSLVIVISHFSRELSGLCEGALSSNASGHRVVIVVIGSTRDILPPELTDLSESGIQVLQSGGADLTKVVSRAIIDIPKIRIKYRLPNTIRTAYG
jgi:hypothetical protein